MLESEIQSRIIKALMLRGHWVQRLNSGSFKLGKSFVRGCEPGTPDILVLYPEFGFLEVKKPKGKLSENQIKWHAKAKKFGINVDVVTSVDEALEAVRSWV